MINKDVFIYKCLERGMTKEAAENLYKKTTVEQPGQNDKFKEMQKMAFDLGFNDSIRIFELLSRQNRSE